MNYVRTVSYHVQQLYALYKGTHVLPLTMDKKPVTGAEGQDGLFASAVYDQNLNASVVKVANTSNQAHSISMTFSSMKKKELLKDGRCFQLQSMDLDKDNTIENPTAILPQESALKVEWHTVHVELTPYTFAVYILNK